CCQLSSHRRRLHSFPTRRSSDLPFGMGRFAVQATAVVVTGALVTGALAWSTSASFAGATTTAARIATLLPIDLSDGTGETSLDRSEEHTSELQSRGHLVCRLLLE